MGNLCSTCRTPHNHEKSFMLQFQNYNLFNAKVQRGYSDFIDNVTSS